MRRAAPRAWFGEFVGKGKVQALSVLTEIMNVFFGVWHSGPIEPAKALFSYRTGIITYRLQRDR